MDERAKVKLTIDGKQVYARDGMTILEAAKANGFSIPTLCHHPALSSWGGCRICVVEVDGSPKLVASCVMPVREGMEVVTQNERILESRRTILEFLFAERNHYCMFCAQSGDCELQSLAYELQMDHLTVAFSFQRFPVDNTNEYMSLDHNRCILCGRCVRACRELAGNSVLHFQNRGSKSLVCKDLNEWSEDSTCDSSGICLQVCPTGAIFNRLRPHQAVKGKDKPLRTVDTACPRCGFLCETTCSVRDNHLIRIEGVIREERPDRGQLCRKGRFEPLKTVGKRLLSPMVKGKDGQWAATTWDDALERVAGRLGSIHSSGGGQAVFGVASGGCSNEELFLFSHLMTRGFPGSHLEALGGDHLRTISQAWREMARTFLGVRETSWKRIPEADMILLVGSDPEETQPLIASLARRGVLENRVAVGVVGPKDVLAPWTSEYVPVAGKDLATAARAFLAEVLSRYQGGDPITRWRKIADEVGRVRASDLLRKMKLTGEEKEAFHRLAGAYAEAKAPLIVAGEGITGLQDAAGLRVVMYLALLKGLLSNNTLRLVILKPQGNSVAAIRLGLLGNGTGESSAPWRGGLVLLDGEQAVERTIGDRLRRAEFLAVITPYFPDEWAQRAHVLIPKPIWSEQAGTYLSLDGGEVGEVKELLHPPAGMRFSWETLMALAGRVGIQPGFGSWEAIRGKVMGEFNLGA